MKRLLLLIVLPIWLIPLAMASPPNPMLTHRNQGSASSLKDRIYVLTVFVSTGDFPKKEKLKFYDGIYEAQDWLKQQAKRYGQIIEFGNGNFGLDNTVIVPEIESGSGSGKESVDFIMPVMRQLGYTHHQQFYEWVLRNTNCTSALVLIVANQPGTSYGIEYDRVYDDKYFTEGCMLYTKYRDGRPFCAASIAHEMLHCFGAWDLYQTFSVSKQQAEKASKMYKNDIMRRVSYNINELEIGPLTAWRIGLTERYSPEFDYFMPSSQNK